MPATSRWSRSASPISRSAASRAAARASSRSPAARRGCPARAAARRGCADELEHGAVPEDGLVLGRRAGRATAYPPASRPAPLDAPPAVHPQMAAQDEAAVEVEQEVLARPPPPARADGRRAAQRAPSPRRADAASRPRRARRREPAADGPRGGANLLPARGEAYDSSRDPAFYRRPLVAGDRVRGRRRDLDGDRRLAVLRPLGERVPRPRRERRAQGRAAAAPRSRARQLERLAERAERQVPDRRPRRRRRALRSSARR